MSFHLFLPFCGVRGAPMGLDKDIFHSWKDLWPTVEDDLLGRGIGRNGFYAARAIMLETSRQWWTCAGIMVQLDNRDGRSSYMVYWDSRLVEPGPHAGKSFELLGPASPLRLCFMPAPEENGYQDLVSPADCYRELQRVFTLKHVQPSSEDEVVGLTWAGPNQKPDRVVSGETRLREEVRASAGRSSGRG